MPEYVVLIKEALRRGEPMDAILTALREHDASTIELIKVVREATGMTLTDAKQLVAASPVDAPQSQGDAS
jgi:ribosomal protein L7/L12